MKKVSLFFLLIIIISVLNMLVTKEKTTAVFKDLSNEHYLLQQANNYNIVYLDVSLVDVSTKNYNTIKKLSILGVYYFINPFISNKFITNYYEFRYDNIKKNFLNLNDYYLNVLKSNHLVNEINKNYINGTKINKVKVYISNGDLYKFLKDNINIKYCYDLNGNYLSAF